MSGNKKAGPSAPSLTRQIEVVERRLVQRRQSSVVHAAALRRGLLARLTSPLGLLVAAGTGFAVERFNLLGRALPSRATGPAATRASTFSLASIMQMMALAGTLVDMLQPIKRPPAARPPDETGQP